MDAYWDDEYRSYERVWGEQPSELAVAAVRYVLGHDPSANPLSVLDIGCGYGRDAFYLLDNLPCSVVGIDLSPNAIDIASRAAQERQQEGVEFRCCNLTELADYSYDIVFMSNLYQVLKTDDRERLRDAVKGTLRPGGLAFLSTLSVNDPEHCGKGIPIPKDPNSFFDKRFVHLSTRRELVDHFDFLAIKELYEHEYYEPRANGEVHHHISWILIGENAGA
jgi:SAM-dependent methyltransferase